MSTDMLQHVIVTLIAAAAAATLVFRMLALAGPGAKGSACDGCSSSRNACATPVKAASGPAVHHPAVLIRQSADGRSGSHAPLHTAP